MKITLKTKNMPLIGLYIIFNIAIFLTIYNTGTISIENVKLYFLELKVKDGIFFTMLSLIIIVAGGMFSNKTKEIIVFWKLSECKLPGCEAFNKYIHNDSRIDIKKLKKKIGEFPTNPEKQNSKWYEIFKSFQDNTIDKIHQDSLLCREISAMTLLMLVFVMPIYFKYNLIAFYYLGFLLFEYLLVRFCAKNTAERLVVNTLALWSDRDGK